MITVLKNLYHSLLDFLYPKRCVICGRVRNYVCDDCLSFLPFKLNSRENGLLALLDYNSRAVKRLIWLLKYRQVRDVAPFLAGLLYDRLLEELAEEELYSPAAGKILIIPIPLSPKRLKTRGFNQAEEIAKSFAHYSPETFRVEPNVLVKTRETSSQVTLHNRAERLENLTRAFSLTNKQKIKGRTIILLDDVSTTGATLAEAEKALKKGRPRKIIKLVIAHG